MKNLIIGLALSSSFLSTSTMASTNYQCKVSYEKKFERIEKNRTIRNITKYGFYGVAIAGSIAVPFMALATDLATLSVMLSIPVTGYAAEETVSLFDREPGLLLATKFYELVIKDREALRVKSYNEFIDAKLKKENELNEIQVTREQVLETYPIDIFELETIVDFALNKVNKKRSRKDLSLLTYEQFQSEVALMLETNVFCTKRPETMRRVIKILKSELI